MFPQAADLSPGEIKAYRTWAFTHALGDPDNDPFFSVEDAPLWITSSGYQLHVLHDDLEIFSHWVPEDASTKQLKAFRNYIVGEEYQSHRFFSLEHPEKWIGPIAFQAYMDTHAEPRDLFNEFTPVSSRAPSRAASSVSMAPSRVASRASFMPSSRASSPASDHGSEMPSHPTSSMSVVEIYDSDSDPVGPPGRHNPQSNCSLPIVQPKLDDRIPISLHNQVPTATVASTIPVQQGKGKAKQTSGSRQIKITRQLKVNEIVHMTHVPSTFDVPRTPTAILIDLSGSAHLLMTPSGAFMVVDRFIRAENQESWDSTSGGHTNGDVKVRGFTPNPEKEVLCRRVILTCNGVNKCEFLDPTLFAGHERFEADEDAMRGLWHQELDQNEAEAASDIAIIARIPPSTANNISLAAPNGLGLSKTVISIGLYLQIYDECQLRSHRPPPIGLTLLPHIFDGKIKPGRIEQRPCTSQMIIHVPVDQSPAMRHKAIVILRSPHNHPMHPRTKPSAEDKFKLGTAVKSTGLTGLTVRTLLNAPSTSSVYGGKPVAESSPAFADPQKIRDFISMQKKAEHPHGMGWEGVLHHLNTKEAKLLKSERYIFTAMSKNGFQLVVTMHPQIAMLIHKVLSLVIDFTFKRVEGKMDEWEVVGIVERFKKRYTLASLYCDTKTRVAFAQLFTEFFDAVSHVTGERFKLAPFYPDAACRVVILDGEVPQAQGFGDFLATYNNPEISQIQTSDPLELLPNSLKTCSLHFERHIEELPQNIPKYVVARLKSILGLKTQEEIDNWHAFCTSQEDPAIKNWYAHKLANPWILPSINKFLSKISPENWDITPNHSNYVESAHAARNAETSTHLPLLTAILKAQERDNIKAQELALMERDGVMPNRWNGSAQREKLSAQRQKWGARKAAIRNDQLTSYDTLKEERDSGSEENKASLERQRSLEAQIKLLQDEMKLDRHRTDLQEQIIALRRDVDAEKSIRREWAVRRADIDKEIQRLRDSGLAGARLKGRRPSERPVGDDVPSVAAPEGDGARMEMADDHLGVGHQAFKNNSPVHFNADAFIPSDTLGSMEQIKQHPVPELNSGHSALGVLPPDHVTEFNREFNANTNQNVLPNDSGGVNDPNQYAVPDLNFFPFSPQDDSFSMFNSNGSGTNFLNEFRTNMNSDLPVSMFADAGPAPAEYVNHTFHHGLHISAKQSADDLEYISSPTIDLMALGLGPGDLFHGIDSGMENHLVHWSGLRLSQELPRLVPPPSTPPSVCTERDQSITNKTAVNPQPEDDNIAPRDINLSFDERNIVTGKRRRTQSSRLTDPNAADSRPTKKGNK
ncbi:hypothetical protein B0H14DRAFT_2596999 [Mycena olivaceomarginata]|nr:hypothetical protein B0H14DRAFT_2596998 [Mycena olivaceomarginata]KAJ7824718.1 hypothetical protein B0H14DRAFT_2596999 [Mycena olivaceomarginata]